MSRGFVVAPGVDEVMSDAAALAAGCSFLIELRLTHGKGRGKCVSAES